MSVPLDRLYHFLNDQSSVDLIIYRWYPHGSRKLTDCTQLFDHGGNLKGYTDKPQIICHDQESLNFSLYNSWPHCYHPDMAQNLCDSNGSPLSIEVREFFESQNLRSAVDLFNIHDRVLLLHSEKHSDQLEKFEHIGFIPIYYFSHALISLDWYRYAQHDKILYQPQPELEQPFLIYNRAWKNSREYRLFFSQCLVDAELHRVSNIKFCPKDEDLHYTDYTFQNPRLSITRKDLEQYLPPNTHQASASADYDVRDYSRCLLEVVLETLFDDTRWHLTEKTFRPIACGRPFILAAPVGSLAYLREYGFKTFGDIIDESYDSEIDPQLRILAIIKEMQRIASFSAKQRNEFVQCTNEIAKFNRQWFFSRGFFDLLVDEYKQNLHHGLQQLAKHRTGQTRQRIVALKHKYQTNNIGTVEEYREIITKS